MASTLPLATCSLKTVYGTAIGVSSPGVKKRVIAKFATSTSTKISHMRPGGHARVGGGGLAVLGRSEPGVEKGRLIEPSSSNSCTAQSLAKRRTSAEVIERASQNRSRMPSDSESTELLPVEPD